MATQEDFKNSFQQIKAYIDKKASETEAKIPAVPDSLPQTYTKKDVTLSASGWTKGEKIIAAESASGDYVYTADKVYNSDDLRSQVTADNTVIYMNGLEQRAISIGDFTGENPITNVSETYKVVSYVVSSYAGSVQAKFYSNCVRINSGNSNYKTFYHLDWYSETVKYTQSLTDTDVKLNSEVRFTLDEASGKTAASVGLKATIAKEDGKLTFTADTQPTADLKGTLEIAETSTEGAAFVVGISPKVPTKTSELTNDSEFITSAALTDYSQEFLTAVQNIFPLGKIEYPFIIPGINDDKAGITFLNRFNFEAGQTYTIDYTVTKTDGTSESRTQDVVATNSSVNVSGATGAMLAFDFREGTGALTVRGGAMVADGFHVVVSSDGGTSFETINGSSASGVEGPSWAQCEIKSIARKVT